MSSSRRFETAGSVINCQSSRAFNSAIPTLLTAREAAHFLKIEVETLYDWIEIGRYEIPHIKRGRFLRFNLDELVKWLSDNTVRNKGGSLCDIR